MFAAQSHSFFLITSHFWEKPRVQTTICICSNFLYAWLSCTIDHRVPTNRLLALILNFCLPSMGNLTMENCSFYSNNAWEIH